MSPERSAKDGVSQESLLAEADCDVALLGAFAAAVPGFITVWDTATKRYVYVSSSIEAALGYPQELLVQRNVTEMMDLVHPADRAGLLASARQLEISGQRAYEGVPVDAPYRIRHADGSWRWLQTTAGVLSRNENGSIRRLVTVSVDVTSDHAAMLEARRGIALAESVYRTARAIFLVLSMDGRVVDVNPYFEELTGYARLDVIGRDWFETFIPPDERDDVRSLFARARAGDNVRSQVNDLLTKDGRRRSIEWYSDLVGEDDGAPYAVSAIGHDVTDRIAREREMRENDERLRLALRAADLGTWELDLTSGAIRHSPRTSELLGFSPAIAASNLADWALKVHPDDAVFLSEFATQPSDHNDLRRIRVRVAADDGAVRTVLLRGNVQYDAAGRPQRAFGIAADHSMQVKAESQLREKRAALAIILETASDLILQLDLHGAIQFANRSAEEFLGIGEGLPRPGSMLDLIDDADIEKAKERFATLAATASETVGEVHMRSPTGMRLVEWHCRTVVDEAGGPIGVTAVGRDVTAARAFEDQLWHSSQRLEVEVVQRTAALSEANGELQREILDRKSVEEQLRSSQTALLVAERLAGVGRWDVDLASGKTIWSDQVYQIYGLQLEENSLEHDTWLRMMHPDDRDRMAGWAKRMTVAGEESRASYRVVRLDGETRWVQCMARTLRGGDGLPFRIIGTVQDVTDLRLNEQRLREAQRIGHMGDWDWNVRMGDVAWSDEIYRIFGLEPRSFGPTYEAFLNYVHAEDRPSVVDAVGFALGGERPYSIDHRIVRATGEVRVVHERAEVSRNERGEAVRMIGTVQDVTEQHAASQALREAELRYRTLFEQSPDSVVIVDPENGRIVEFNDVACRLLGYSPEEFGALRLQDIQAFDSPRLVVDRLRRILDDGRDTCETLHRTKNGEIRTVIVSSRLIELSGMALVQSFFHDVTELRRSESRQHEVDKLAATGRMAARVAHEINNPLAGIKNAFQLVKAAVPADFQHYHYVQRIESEIERISGIVRQMFDLYRPATSHDSPADLREILSDIRALLAPSLRGSEIRITDALHPDASLLAASESLLRPVIFNILQNAVEASPRGATIDVRSTVQSDVIELTIADQGSGIPESLRTKIFEPFFTTKSGLATGGLGLGLAIAKSTVEALGGTLDFVARPEGGTEFQITLPRVTSSTMEVKS